MYCQRLIADLGLSKGSTSANAAWLHLLLLALSDAPDANETHFSANPARELLGRLAPHIDGGGVGLLLRQMLAGSVDRLDRVYGV